MRKDTVSLRSVEVRLLFPPIMERYEGTTLHELNVELCKRHTYESFEVIGGNQGARFYSPGSRELQMGVGQMMVKEYGGLRAINLVGQEIVDIVKTIKDHLRLPQFAMPFIEMEVIWPSDTGINIGEAMRTRFINISGDSFQLLEPAHLNSVGLSFSCSETQEEDRDALFEFSLQPYARDPKQLKLDLTAHYHVSFDDPDDLGQLIINAYEFMGEKLTAFVLALSLE